MNVTTEDLKENFRAVLAVKCYELGNKEAAVGSVLLSLLPEGFSNAECVEMLRGGADYIENVTSLPE